MVLMLLSAASLAAKPVPQPEADSILTSVFDQLAPLHRLDVEISTTQTGALDRRYRFRTDLDAGRMVLAMEVPTHNTVFFEKPTGFFAVRLESGRTLTGAPVSREVLDHSLAMPDPLEVFDRAGAFKWKHRRVDLGNARASASQWIVVLSDDEAGRVPPRQEWTIQKSPVLLLRIDAFNKGGGKKPDLSTKIEWAPVGPIWLPVLASRTIVVPGAELRTMTRWSHVVPNTDFAADWFPSAR